jgi:hypothetical protein
MDLTTIIALTGTALAMFAAGAGAGFLHFGKRFYNQGYDDGLEDGGQHAQPVMGECGNCGWEPPYGELTTMIEALIEHATNDCPAKRY